MGVTEEREREREREYEEKGRREKWKDEIRGAVVG